MRLTIRDIESLRSAGGYFYGRISTFLQNGDKSTRWIDRAVGREVPDTVFQGLVTFNDRRNSTRTDKFHPGHDKPTKKPPNPQIPGSTPPRWSASDSMAYFIFAERVSKADFDAHEIIPDDTDPDREFIAIVG